MLLDKVVNSEESITIKYCHEFQMHSAHVKIFFSLVELGIVPPRRKSWAEKFGAMSHNHPAAQMLEIVLLYPEKNIRHMHVC